MQVIVCLGAFAWDAALRLLAAAGVALPRPRPRFGHGVELALEPPAPVLLGSFHPSQQNTFTGVLTEPMLDAVLLRRARWPGLTRQDHDVVVTAVRPAWRKPVRYEQLRATLHPQSESAGVAVHV